jgi:hypothetical protein
MNKAIAAIIVFGLLMTSFGAISFVGKNANHFQGKVFVEGSRSTVHVNDTMTWGEIQVAIEGLGTGDIIHFDAGDYDYQYAYNWQVNTSCTIEGDGNSTFIFIYDQDGDTYNRYAFAIQEVNVTIKNLSLGSGVQMNSSSGNEVLMLDGIFFNDSADHTPIYAVNTDNGGTSADSVITDCVFNWSGSQVVVESWNVNITNSTINANYGIYAEGWCNVQNTNMTFTSVTYAIEAYDDSIVNNSIITGTRGISVDADCIITNSNIHTNASDILTCNNAVISGSYLNATETGSGIYIYYDLDMQNTTIISNGSITTVGFTEVTIKNCTITSPGDNWYALDLWADLGGSYTLNFFDNEVNAYYCFQSFDRLVQGLTINEGRNTFNGYCLFRADTDYDYYEFDFADFSDEVNTNWTLINENSNSPYIYNLHNGSVKTIGEEMTATNCQGTYFNATSSGVIHLYARLFFNSGSSITHVYESTNGWEYDTTPYGYSNGGYKLYSNVTSAGYQNLSFHWYFTVPSGWSDSLCQLYSRTYGMNLSLFRGTGNVSYVGEPQWFYFNTGTTTNSINLTYEYNVTMATDQESGTSFYPYYGLVLRNDNFNHNYTHFTLNISDWFGPTDLAFEFLDWDIYTYDDGISRTHLTNNTISWNSSDFTTDKVFTYGDWYWIYPSSGSDIPLYAPQGNYTINSNVNADGATDTQTTYVEVGYYGNVQVYPTGGRSMLIMDNCVVGETNVLSANDIAIRNYGNTVLTGINMSIGAFYGDDMSVTYLNSSFQVAGHSFNSTGEYNLSLNIPIGGVNMIQYFQASISVIPTMLSQNYTATLSWMVYDASGSVNDDSIMISLSVNTSTVIVVAKYADNLTSERNDMGLKWPMMIEGNHNVSSTWMIFENHGRDNVTLLNFSFSELQSLFGPGYSLNISGNSQLIGQTGATYDINSTGYLDIYTTIQPGLSTAFRFNLINVTFDTSGPYLGDGSGMAMENQLYMIPSSDLETATWNYLFGISEAMIPVASPVVYTSGNRVEFYSPLSSGVQSFNSIVFQNIYFDPLPSNAITFTQNPNAVVQYSIRFGDSPILHPVNGTIRIEFNSPMSFGINSVGVQLFVDSVTTGYNVATEYNHTMTITTEQLYGFSYPLQMRIFNVSIHVNPVVASINIVSGMNFVSFLNNSQYYSARDIINATGCQWVAMWNVSHYTYYFDDDFGTNFVINYGEGYIVRKGSGSILNMTGNEAAHASFTVPSGLSIVAQPTNDSVFADVFLDNSANISWIAQWTGSSYRYFFSDDPTGPGSVNYEIPSNSAVWARSTGEDGISY